MNGTLRGWSTRLEGYVVAMAGIAATSVIIGLVLSRQAIANISMLYLLPVLVAAVHYGHGPAIFASMAGFLAFDVFFIHPVHTFTVADPAEWIALLLFLVVAVVTGQLAAAQRRRADEAQRREREAVALHDLNRILNNTDDLDAALQAVAHHLQSELDLVGCAILLPERGAEGGRAVTAAVVGEPPAPDEMAASTWLASSFSGARREQGARRWVRVRRPDTSSLAGQRLVAQRPDRRIEFVPLSAGEHTVGMLRLAALTKRAPWNPEAARLIAAAAEQIGRTIERARLRHAATEAEVLRKAEAARQAVLASVSHDLRTPLASIQASAESLAQHSIQWSDEERDTFAGGIVQEAQRMGRLVENLLDMSRIEAGRLDPDRSWFPLETLVDDVLARMESLTAGHRVQTDIPDGLPPVPLDYVQIGEVLVNLIENAVKYTPPGSTIRTMAARQGEWVTVSVQDDGPGIPADAQPHIFEKFFRVTGGDQARAKGTGLGLAIARGFVEAHGGTIEAHSPPPGQAHGAVFSFRLPLNVEAMPSSATTGTPATLVEVAG